MKKQNITRPIRISVFSLILLGGGYGSLAFARPILTEEVATLGRHHFEAAMSLSERFDEFKPPESEYTTVVAPVSFTFGLKEKLDLGIHLDYLDHKLDQEGVRMTGSQTGRFSPELKWAVNQYFSLLFLWTLHKKEESEDALPIANGNEYQLDFLFKIPAPIPITVNTGYAKRQEYSSRLGVRDVPTSRISPGNIFQNRLSIEYPLAHGLSLLNEWGYYRISKKEVDHQTVAGSKGSALDAFLGVNWAKFGWNIGGLVGTSLLNETHTSFDLYRGAGDLTYKILVSYTVSPSQFKK